MRDGTLRLSPEYDVLIIHSPFVNLCVLRALCGEELTTKTQRNIKNRNWHNTFWRKPKGQKRCPNIGSWQESGWRLSMLNRQIKVFRIMSDRYRNHRRWHALRITLICVLRNNEIKHTKGLGHNEPVGKWKGKKSRWLSLYDYVGKVRLLRII